MRTRWLITLAVAVALVVVPIVVVSRPVADSSLTASELAARIRSSSQLSWSGLVESSGGLQLPTNDTLAGVGEVFGSDNHLRVWWRNPENWRIDRLRSTGEVDLFRQDGYTIRWEFETQTAVSAPVSQVRLPDVSDLVPVSLAQFALSGVPDQELSRLPARRIAGLDAVGLRVAPVDPATSIGRVDIWADPVSGLPLRIEIGGTDDPRPALTTEIAELRIGSFDPGIMIFSPPAGSTFRFDQSVDVAAEANAFAPYEMPARLAGLPSRTGRAFAAAEAYGQGPTLLVALPLRGSVAGPLRARMREGGSQRTAVGLYAPTGPIGLLVTYGRLDPAGQGGGFLLAGTVNAEVLQRAATDLLGRQ